MSDDRLKDEARDALTRFLEGQHLRKTPERYAILDKVFEMSQHFYIDSLQESLEKASYHVCKATLYNAMQLFVDAGLVRKHQFDNQPAQYERVVSAQTGNHYHLVCRRCGKVKEAKAPEMLKELTKVKSRTFYAEFYSAYVYGICSTCMRKIKKESKQ
ncbi:MAG: Fur family transcriptional regulator [Muribaculaceae bacterium]